MVEEVVDICFPYPNLVVLEVCFPYSSRVVEDALPSCFHCPILERVVYRHHSMHSKPMDFGCHQQFSSVPNQKVVVYRRRHSSHHSIHYFQLHSIHCFRRHSSQCCRHHSSHHTIDFPRYPSFLPDFGSCCSHC